MKEIIVEGIVSGDHECFCLDVTSEVYKQVTGAEPTERSISTFNKDKMLYKLYPDDILSALGINSWAKCKLIISGEPIED